MASLLLSITLAAELLAAAGAALSAAYPRKRIWPPPRPWSWQSVMMWLAFGISAAGVIATGVADWGSWDLAPWIRWAVGAPLWLAGNGLALWGTVTLGLARSYGRDGALVHHGPYRFSRNPQYVGFTAGLLGWPLVSSSLPTLYAGIAGAVACMLAPLCEEPWLLCRYGSAFECYRRSVPRFLGLGRRRDRG